MNTAFRTFHRVFDCPNFQHSTLFAQKLAHLREDHPALVPWLAKWGLLTMKGMYRTLVFSAAVAMQLGPTEGLDIFLATLVWLLLATFQAYVARELLFIYWTELEDPYVSPCLCCHCCARLLFGLHAATLLQNIIIITGAP